MPLPFNDLRAQYLAHKTEIDAAVQRVLDSGWYVLGEEVSAFEEAFARFIDEGDGASDGQPLRCVGVNSGTDALALALRAAGVGPGDEVITVSHTAVATVAAIEMTGATPVLVDIEPDTYTLDPAALDAALSPRTRAVVPVHLYGHPADLCPILDRAHQHGASIGKRVSVIEDCAQAHGARYFRQRVGAMGDLACFSFYPTKNLGALGDGGAVLGRDPALIERVHQLREYGWTAQSRYISQMPGVNSRLDALQAAVLCIKLNHLDADNERRRELAARYRRDLPAWLAPPVERSGCRHVYHLFVVRAPSEAARDRLRASLAERGIATAIHYPLPVHEQPAYAARELAARPLPVTEHAARTIVSLPLHPALTDDDVDRVLEALHEREIGD